MRLTRRRAAEDIGGTRPVTLAPLTVLELSPPELVACAAEAGYDGVGLRLIRATDEEPVRATIGQTPMIRETRRRLDDTGLFVLDVEVLRLRPDTDVRRDFGGVLETAAYLGATQALVTGNDREHSRLADNLAELADIAAEFGIRPNLEPMPWTEVRNLAEATAILQRCQDGAGVLVDALHYDRELATPDDLHALPSEWISYVQICDGLSPRPTAVDELRYQGRNARLFPGEGGIDLTGMLRALPDVPVSIEAPVQWPAPAGVRARAALRAARTVVGRADASRLPLSA
ncbi:sugar phosphate isomerase/epimerase family protein [Mycolicibacterium sp. jd]|uniref:sugar phosphate isomerase/epimerase family protein n=1 Tax=Mycolicibacterium TaxID=1866885 RepID=UPI001F197BBA|nr:MULTISPECIES: TIM barrel protein [Mycolicibacterium]MDW5614260.1 TIM barrel protein [Mycolicibacterium sp. D5.8-2]UJL27189.1 sugar phosphate isomerase/epimerase [Mycolicibacterium vanbaalenii]WND59316.1 TIM barrel protein [Mycolicibacterium vanbaalenii]